MHCSPIFTTSKSLVKAQLISPPPYYSLTETSPSRSLPVHTNDMPLTEAHSDGRFVPKDEHPTITIEVYVLVDELRVEGPMQLCENEAQFDEGETVEEDECVSFGLDVYGSISWSGKQRGINEGRGGRVRGKGGGFSACLCVCEGKSDWKEKGKTVGVGEKYFLPRQTRGPR